MYTESLCVSKRLRIEASADSDVQLVGTAVLEARCTTPGVHGTVYGVRVRLPASRVARCMPIGTPLIFGQIGSIGTAVLEYSIGIGRIRRPGAQLSMPLERHCMHKVPTGTPCRDLHHAWQS